jgi:AcrR family transcriptional regulator
MPKREAYHHGDLQRALIDAAVALISESDVKSLSLRQVAKKVGVSHAAPYRHFEDKTALLAVVAAEGFRDFTNYLKGGVATAPDDPRQQLTATGQAYLRFALDRPAHFQVMFGEFPIFESKYEPLIKVSNQSFQVLIDVIESGQRQGVFRPGDAHQMGLCAWSQVHGLALLLLAGRLGAMDADAIATLSATMTDILLAGLGAET